jgi:hypothetical protein
MSTARLSAFIHTIREYRTCVMRAPLLLLIHDAVGNSTAYHAGQDYGTSMHSLGVDYDAAGFPVHIPASKLGYNGHLPQYVNYLPSP